MGTWLEEAESDYWNDHWKNYWDKTFGEPYTVKMTPKEIEETMKQPRQRSIPKKVSNSQEIRLLMKYKRFYRPRSFSERLKKTVSDRPNYNGAKQAVNNEFD